MRKRIENIIKNIELNKPLKNKDIEEILNNISYVSVYDFTNCISHLTSFGKNKLVQVKRDEILEELHRYLYWNCGEKNKRKVK